MIPPIHPAERITHCVEKSDLLDALRVFLPTEAILFEPEMLKPYECDGLAAYQTLPWVVVLPATVEAVQSILRLCHKHGVPVVARGAGTGLSGGALPLENGVLISMVKFNNIRTIDGKNLVAVVEPGVTNLAISKKVVADGLYYAPDPSSQIACTIGGNVAENSGGVHCLKYGLTTHNILRLKVVTMTGELLVIGSHGFEIEGYDLLAILTGSEGMLGIIVEVSVKLLPQAPSCVVMLAVFDCVETAGEAVAGVIAAGLIPAGLEMMDNTAICAAEDFCHAGYPVTAQAILLCEIDGTVEQVIEQSEQLYALLLHLGAQSVEIARDELEQEKMWAGRKAAFPAVGRISPDYYCMDGTIPRYQLGAMLRSIAELSIKYGLPVANVFHAGDGNLHPLILYDGNVPGDFEKAERLGSDILLLSIRMGGTITGEHGVGVEKINHMCVQFSLATLNQFHAIKEAFDEKGLLNPGKGLPSLRRCAEFGAMHVHHGELPHKDLPRF